MLADAIDAFEFVVVQVTGKHFAQGINDHVAHVMPGILVLLARIA
jgi:hypothetical protein